MYEYPPILTGTEQEQIRALRDYLVRQAQSLDQSGMSGGAGGLSAEALENIRTQLQQLKGLIDRNEKKMRRLVEELAQNTQDMSEDISKRLSDIADDLTALRSSIPADGSGAALGKDKTVDNALELADGWRLILHGPDGAPISLDGAKLLALLSLL